MHNPFQDLMNKRLEKEKQEREEWEQLINAGQETNLYKDKDRTPLVLQQHGEYTARVLKNLQTSLFPTCIVSTSGFEWTIGKSVPEWDGDIRSSGWHEILNVRLIYVSDAEATFSCKRKDNPKEVTCFASEDNLVNALREMFA